MPRSRRRHHSRSRTRSRSHSYDRDREPKRRKIESYESPHKGSSSAIDKEEIEDPVIVIEENEENLSSMGSKQENQMDAEANLDANISINSDSINISQDNDDNKTSTDNEHSILDNSKPKDMSKKSLTPKQLEKEKLRKEKTSDREKRKQELLGQKLKIKEEKERLRQEKLEQKQKEKQEKTEQKQKEIEVKQKEKELKEEKKKKEREEKEQKRKEKEEKDEQKRKEKEEKEEQKRREVEEKHKEKQKQEEKKQKAAAAFVTFFTKKTDNAIETKKQEDCETASTFMPFEVKADMKLAPISRISLTGNQKSQLIKYLKDQNGKTYLAELKSGREPKQSGKTWPVEDLGAQDDVIVLDNNPGESVEELPKSNKMRAKFLKFNDNRRPPYYGTWRKKSRFIKSRRPFGLDKNHFDYEIDSGDDWEEEDDLGESLRGSDDDEKENESENEYEEDNEFFVPHGYLSDDEINDEECAVESPEMHKAKLKLLKKVFDDEMMGKTRKIKPRFIGCVWFNKSQENVDPTIHEFLKPFSVISNGPVTIQKRSKLLIQTPSRRHSAQSKLLPAELIPDFLKFIHGATVRKQILVDEFLNQLINKNIPVDTSKASLKRQFVQFADWIKCPEDGSSMYNKFCWYVRLDVREKYNVELSLNK